MVLPALHETGNRLAVVSLTTGHSPHSVRIAYRRETAGNGATQHVLICSFMGGRFSQDRQALAGIVADGQTFGPAQLHLLKRYWLEEPENALLAPTYSQEELAHLPEVSSRLALPLQHIAASLPKIAIYAMLAPAYALIYGLIGRINLAFGELAIIGGQGALIGAIGGGMAGGSAPSLVLLGGLLLALAATATHGDIMARCVFERLVGKSGQAMLVASIGLAVAAMEYVRLAQGDGHRWTPPVLNAPVHLARAGDFIVTVTEGAILTVAASLSVALLLILAMRRSAFGRRWRACADEPFAAALMGVDPKAVLIHSFSITSLLAGFAGFIMTMHYGGIGFSGGLGIGLKALIAAIAGGIGSVGGAMLGAVLIGGFEALWSSVFPLEHADIAVYTLLVLLLIFRPGGLFGWRDNVPRRV